MTDQKQTYQLVPRAQRTSTAVAPLDGPRSPTSPVQRRPRRARGAAEAGAWGLPALLKILLNIEVHAETREEFEERLATKVLPHETLIALMEKTLPASELLKRAQSLIVVRPRDANSYRILALACAVSGQIAMTVKSAERAAELAPLDILIAEELAHWQRYAGCMLQNTAWLTKAAVLFDELCDEDVTQAEYPFYAGLLKSDLQLFEQAELSFREAISRQPRHAKAHLHLGDALLFLGRNTEAQPLFIRAAELFALAIDDCASIRIQPLIDQARESYSRAIEAGCDPSDFEIQLRQLQCLEERSADVAA
jgi:tetratricopeptide (TPR) repeat protein